MTHYRIDSTEDTLVFVSENGAMPALAYWGPRLPAGEPVLPTPTIPHGMLDTGEQLSLLPEAGRGFFGHPGILAHRNGRDFVTQFVLEGAETTTARLKFKLADRIAQIAIELDIEIDTPTGVVSALSSLTNLGGDGLDVQWLASIALPVPHGEIMLFDGRWGFEFQPVRQTLKTGAFVKENRTGRTSHFSWPFLIAGEQGFDDLRGEVFALHLAWSGNHRLLAEKLRDGRVQLQTGVLFEPGEFVLKNNEVLIGALAYAARSSSGLNGLSDRFHPFVRRDVLTDRLVDKPRPVNFNSWEAVYFDHDVDRLKQLADLAAEVGAERFVLDDGWFKNRPNDRSGLGDWTPDPKKYPDGLGPLIEHVRSRGMIFGLWVEPEMANADSDLLRAHPDWTLHIEGREQPLGRNQYVLDLSREEVWLNLYHQLDALLSRNDIGYLKWDMNRDLSHAASGGAPGTFAQVEYLYHLLMKLRDAHPSVEIESCSSGGGRADFRILRNTDRIWTSDCNDPVDRQHIQRAFSIFLPPEIMGSHVGARRSHTTGRVTDIEMRAFTAFFGHMGIEADLSRMRDDERKRLAEIIALHKQWRSVLHGGRTLRLNHDDPHCCAFMVIRDGKGLVSAAQLDTPRLMPHAPLRLAGLALDRRYTTRLLNPIAQPERRQKSVSGAFRGEPVTTSGSVLMQAGLAIPVLMVGEIAVFAIEEAP